MIELVAIDRQNVRKVTALEVAPEQRRFVATNAESLAEALFAPEAWYRAIAADGELVGFVMLELYPDRGEYGVWRFMIDHRFQKRGYARAAMDKVVEHVRTLPNAVVLLLSYVPGEHGPQGFYEKLGFVPTGDVVGGEVVMALAL